MALGKKVTGARDDLDALLDGVNGLDALAALSFASIAGFRTASGAYTEAVPTVLVEYLWARLLRRSSLVAARPADIRVEYLVHCTNTAVMSEMAGRLDGDPAALANDPHARFRMQSLWAYDPVAAEAEAARWQDLLILADDDALERIVGLSVDEIANVVKTLSMRWMVWSLWYAGVDEEPSTVPATVMRMRAAAARGAGETVRPGSGALLASTVAEIAERSEVPLDRVARLVDLLVTPGDTPAEMPFDRLVWQFRRRPLARWRDLLVTPIPYNLLVALRPTLEQRLRAGDPRAGDRYSRAKGRWLESRVIALLQEKVTPDQAYRALRIPRPDDEGPERDGALRIDLCGVAVEAKGGSIPPSAHLGADRAQKRAISRLIHDGVDQADSTIEALRAGASVTGVNVRSGRREQVDFGNIARWIPLVVTLDDMSAIVASFRAAFAVRPKQQPVPIVTTLDDLTLLGKQFRLAAQMLHWFVVRERIARAKTPLIVTDEVDWFNVYVARGGAGVTELLEAFQEVDVPVMVRGADARRGVPVMGMPNWTSPYERLLHRWQRDAEDGWLEGSFAMLDLSHQQSAELPQTLADIKQQCSYDKPIAIATLRPAGDRRQVLHFLAAHDTSEPMSVDQLGRYLHAQAPDAELHITIGTLDGTVETLQFMGVVVVRA